MRIINLAEREVLLIRTPQGDVKLTVTAIRGHYGHLQARLGFEANKGIAIMRSELVPERSAAVEVKAS